MKDFDLNELDLSTIGAWPLPVKIVVIIVVCVIVLALGYFLDTQGQLQDLERQRAQENTLKQDFEKKQAKAANLDAYKKQMKKMEVSFGTMLRQLPSKTNVDDFVQDMSQTALASGTELKLIKPQTEQQIEFYAELPVTMQITGDYHKFGDFVSGVAALPRIVTLHNISIAGDKSDQLTMNITAKTYRYLDENEMAASRKKKRKR